MYFNYDYYGSINLTYFKLITLYSFFLVSISFQPKKKKNTHYMHHLKHWVQALKP